METGNYLYLAHPDLFHFIGDPALYEQEFRRLCVYLKEKQIPIEINQLGLADHRQYPNPAFLKIAESVGNTAIIGCDAHHPSALLDIDSQQACKKFGRTISLAFGGSISAAVEISSYKKQRTRLRFSGNVSAVIDYFLVECGCFPSTIFFCRTELKIQPKNDLRSIQKESFSAYSPS